jgi:hypothetical protein
MKKHTKRICAALLAGTLLLSSCAEQNESSGSLETSESTTASMEASGGTAASSTTGVAQVEKPEYEKLKCETIKNFYYVNLICGESTMAINICLPENFKLHKENGKAYSVTRFGKEVGKLYFGTESELDEGKTEVYTDTKTNLGIETKYSVNRFGEGEHTYRRKITFKYTDLEETRYVTLDLDYTSVDDACVRSMRGVPNVWSVVTLPKYNTISFPENGSKNVLILGNSFVYTSRIGDLVRALCTSKGMGTVDAVSRANVSIKDYAADSHMLKQLESGKYGILFLNGLFSPDDMTGLEKVYNACKKGGTTLVIFPAHNESANQIKNAQQKYPELVTIDWRNEIIKLIHSGIDKWQFCIDDGPEHSTPLAGYVGASMIYRALYGEMPTTEVSYSACGVSQGTVEGLLGDYVETGIIYGASKSTIYFFEE